MIRLEVSKRRDGATNTTGLKSAVWGKENSTEPTQEGVKKQKGAVVWQTPDSDEAKKLKSKFDKCLFAHRHEENERVLTTGPDAA